MTTRTFTGRCLCGAVAFRIAGPIRQVHACHCSMCRRQGGNFNVSGDALKADLSFTQDRGLHWYRSSNWASRGFCRDCGSALFWDGGGETIGVNLGALDQPTGLRIESHIYVADKADFTVIDDDLPQFADHETPMPTG